MNHDRADSRAAVAAARPTGRSVSVRGAGAVRRVRGGPRSPCRPGSPPGSRWFIAHDVIGRPPPFFAPIAAVITLASGVGQRLRRTTELVLGVALGIGIGDALIQLIGSGPWQIGLIVVLAVIVATASAAVPRWSTRRPRRRCWSPR